MASSRKQTQAIEPVVKLLPTMKAFVEDESRFCFCVASVQTGKSFCSALKHVLMRIERPGLSVLMSAGEAQSKELMYDKVARHLQGIGAVFSDEFFRDDQGGTSITQHIAKLPNGSRLLCLPANPRTARGYSGDVLLDEFGVHEHSREIWAAMMTRITRGYRVDVMGTYYGTDNKFYELGEMLGLQTGVEPAEQPVEANGWHGYWLSMPKAIEEGLDVDFETLARAIDDEDIVNQDYLCIPMKGGDQYIPLETVKACESDFASLEFDWKPRPNLYAGWDIASKRDFSVIWIVEVIGHEVVDLGDEKHEVPRMRTVGVIEMRNKPTPDQETIARSVAPLVERFCLDATGMGLSIAERLQRMPRTSIEQVTFTLPIAERLASDGKRAMEERRLLLPMDNRTIRSSFTSLKRYQAGSGHMRLDAGHSKTSGHADHAWAAWLAVSAATDSGYVPASMGECAGATSMGKLRGMVF